MTTALNLDAVRSAIQAISGDTSSVAAPAVTGGVVTIARETGTGASAIAERVCSLLNERHAMGDRPWLSYSRNLVHLVAEEHELAEDLVARLDEHDQGVLDEIFASVTGQPTVHEVGMKIARTIRGLARPGRAVIVGRGAATLLAGMPNALHVRLVAPFEWRVRAWARSEGISEAEAREQVTVNDRERSDYVRTTLHRDVTDASLYDLVINVAALTQEHTAGIITRAVEELHLEDA